MVRFYDDLTEAGPLFGAFDVYVLSSRSEGLPVVLLEAMAAGTPIVATTVGGVSDTLGEREGYLVPAEDAEALARAISLALSDPADALQRADSARKRLARDFALDHWLDRYEAVYRHALRHKHPRIPMAGPPAPLTPAAL